MHRHKIRLRVRGVRTRLFLPIALIVLLGITAMAYVSNRQTNQQLSTLAEQQADTAVGSFQESIDLQRHAKENYAQLLAAEPEVINATVAQDVVGLYQSLATQRAKLALGFVAVASTSGQVLARIGVAEGDIDQPLVSTAVTGLTQSSAVLKGTGLAISASTPIKGPGGIVGVMLIGKVLDEASLVETRQGTGVDLALFANGTMVATSIESPAVRELLASGPASVLRSDLSRFGLYADAHPMAGGGTVLVLVPTTDAGGITSQSRLLLLTSVAVLLAALALVAWALSRDIVRPLGRLRASALALQQGDYAQRVPGAAIREIDELGASFNQLAAQLGEHVATIVENGRRLQTVLDSSPDLIAIVNLDGTFAFANSAFQRLLGCSPDELVGTGVRELVHPEDQPRLAAAIADPVRGTDGLMGIRLRTAGHQFRDFEANGEVLVDNAGEPTGIVVVARDITDRTQAAAERERLEAKLLQSQKMESVGQLAGGIAHDFNNILNVITGTAFLVSQQLKAGDPLQEDMQEITRAADRAAAMTRQLLAFSRKQMLQPKIMDLGTVVRDLEGMLQRLIGEDVDIVVAPCVGSCTIKADPGQIEQVVVNLAVNARDAMPRGGILTIKTSSVTVGRTRPAADPLLEPGAYVELSVNDTGAGMDDVTRAQIFEPFFTTKGVGKGTGLGLSTVYGIVQQSGGTISVDSAVGEGTTFKIWFPQVEETAPADEAVPAASSVRGRETILVVEDYPALRMLSKRMLEGAGYTVLVAGDGREALKVLEGHDGSVDLLLTDVVMPGMNGRELAERVTETRPEINVIYASGYTDDALMRHRVDADAAHFLGKPYTQEDLTRTVRTVLDAGHEAAVTAAGLA